MKYTDSYGNICTRLVDHPDMISKFFATSNTIDTHNQMCQFNLALEKKVVNKKSLLSPFNNIDQNKCGGHLSPFKLAWYHKLF